MPLTPRLSRFHFDLKSYKTEDYAEWVYPNTSFRLHYYVTRGTERIISDWLVFSSSAVKGFTFDIPDLEVGDSVLFVVYPFKEGRRNTFTWTNIYAFGIEEIYHTFWSLYIESDYDYIPFDPLPPEHVPSIPDRKFGNDSVLLRWHDLQMELRYIETVVLSGGSDVTTRRVSEDIKEMKNYAVNHPHHLEITLVVGDIWLTDSTGQKRLVSNRNKSLRILHDIFKTKTIFTFMSDLLIMPYSVFTEMKIEQSYMSNNTYNINCKITEISIIKELPKLVVIRDKEGRYEEHPFTDIDLPFLLSRVPRKISDDHGLWERIVEFFTRRVIIGG